MYFLKILDPARLINYVFITCMRLTALFKKKILVKKIKDEHLVKLIIKAINLFLTSYQGKNKVIEQSPLLSQAMQIYRYFKIFVRMRVRKKLL